MKNLIAVLAWIPGMILFLNSPLRAQDSRDNVPPCLSGQHVAPTTSLSGPEKESLAFMREEEKLARDVYLHFKKQYTLRPFENISKSEQAHMNALLFLINQYGLEDPAAGEEEGKFRNKDLQKLYQDLTTRGSKSEEEALRAAAWIEETDIMDLKTALDNTVENPDMERVYTHLMQASEQHLRAFVRVLKLRGIDYEPVVLGEEEFKNILEH